jgi:hypothetical protein
LGVFKKKHHPIPSRMKKGFPLGDSIMAKIMTTKEVSEYLKLHEITIYKYAAQGKKGLKNQKTFHFCL